MMMFLAWALLFGVCGGFVPVVPHRSSVVLQESLAGGLWRQVSGGITGLVNKGPSEKPLAPPPAPTGPGKTGANAEKVAAIDERAKSGEVSFEDFLEIGRSFKKMNGIVPGMPALTQKQIDDTLAKFDTHERIVLSMLDEERQKPQLIMDEFSEESLKKTKAPRVQRIARAAKVPEKEVAMFCAEFEAMRQSTQRIANGEDPDAVNDSIGKSNRAQRRALKEKQKKQRR